MELGTRNRERPVREVAILVTGAKFRSSYELYAHVIAAERGLAGDGTDKSKLSFERAPKTDPRALRP
jgi:hypothetical protein